MSLFLAANNLIWKKLILIGTEEKKPKVWWKTGGQQLDLLIHIILSLSWFQLSAAGERRLIGSE
jgi:hypothetical protein